jgi:hypothetical protein
MGLLEKANRILARGKITAPASLYEKGLACIGRSSRLSSDNKSPQAALESFHKENPLFSVLLAAPSPNTNADEKNNLFGKLTRMVYLMGKVVPLSEDSAGRNLVLIPQSMDRELIAHRLEAALPVKIALAFDAGSPAEALEKLKPFL